MNEQEKKPPSIVIEMANAALQQYAYLDSVQKTKTTTTMNRQMALMCENVFVLLFRMRFEFCGHLIK